MSISKTSIKFVSIVLLVPIFIYGLFFYMEGDFAHAWFWATAVGIGNLMLLYSSPNRKITEGIRMLGSFNWIFIIAVSLSPFFIMLDDNIFIRIVKSVCLFVSFVGYSVFQVRGTSRKTPRGR